MKPFVKRIYFSYLWTNIVKSWWFLLLIQFRRILCKSLNCRSEKLKRKRFLLELKWTFIHIILTWCRIFGFEFSIISFSCSFIKISSIIKRIKIGSDSGRFEMTWWLCLFILKRFKIDTVFSWADIICAVKWESSSFIFSPNSTCWV